MKSLALVAAGLLGAVTVALIWICLQPARVMEGQAVTPIGGMALPTAAMTALVYGCTALTTVLVFVAFRRE